MYAATIYKDSVKITEIYDESALEVELEALRCIEDCQDINEGFGEGDYYYQVCEVESLPEMPRSIRWLYQEQYAASFIDPAVPAPCWEQLYEEDDPELVCLCFEA